MIWIRGEQWGTAGELAAALGADVTPAMVRRWRDRDDLTTRRIGRLVYSPLVETAMIERDKRLSHLGRPRSLDTAAAQR